MAGAVPRGLGDFPCSQEPTKLPLGYAKLTRCDWCLTTHATLPSCQKKRAGHVKLRARSLGFCHQWLFEKLSVTNIVMPLVGCNQAPALQVFRNFAKDMLVPDVSKHSGLKMGHEEDH
jgi:hypothetical protein